MFEDEYNGHRFRMEPSGENFSFRYTSVGDHDLTLRGNLVEGSVQGTIETTGEYIVSWITAGFGATDLENEPVRLEPGRPAMFVRNRPAVFDFSDFRQNLMHFDGEYLERIAGDHEGTEGPLLFDTTAQPTGESLRAWVKTVARVAHVVYDDTSSMLLRSEANHAAAVALLDTFPHTALNAPADITVPTAGRMRTAIEFMHANSHLPLRTEAIAEAAGMSLRTLQSTFRRDLGLTPHDYLRRIRLDRVREDLRHADPGSVTVSEVARRWGFAHLGRFSASYAERFGEQPRSTLRD